MRKSDFSWLKLYLPKKKVKYLPINEFIVSCSSQPCRRSLKRSTVGHQTCGALPSCCGSWWPERFHLLTCPIWKLAWRLADPPFLTHPITFKACWNCFSIAPYLVLPACSFRLPWRAWGPPSHLEYRHIFASLWRYAWTKTRRRGLNLIWLCQFWKKCRTNKKQILPCPPVLNQIRQMVVWCLPVLP